jgi:hypothetical protein
VTVKAELGRYVGKAGSVIADRPWPSYGVLWFFYGFQRGLVDPGILSPAIAIRGDVGRLGMTFLVLDGSWVVCGRTR